MSQTPSHDSRGEGTARDDQKKTRLTKHVHLDRERPKLNNENKSNKSADAKPKSGRRGGRSRSSQNASAEKRAQVGAPKRDPKAKLNIIPLGGLDAIGKNMTVFECGDDIILDDAGIMFPDDDHPGIDLILPDYTYLLEHAEKLRGILITHGHEDHTGTLPYLLKDLGRQVPIYGSKLTLGLIEGKLKEHNVKNAKLIEVKPGQRIKLGCMTCDFFSVNHSIPGAMGVFFQSPAGTVLHTGDFKLDQSPIDGVHTDFGALARFSAIGVDLMMSDSTNASNPNFTPSEAEVGKTLRSVIGQAKGRVIVASFASHIHRMQQICDAAVENGRKVVVTGRSMIQNTEISRRLGYLKISDKDIVDAYDLKGIPADQVVIMCTGSQGEPLSALARISNGDHRTISIDEGDTVIISATPVPGNEKAVTRVVNSLSKIGADVWDKSRARVHVSGHGGAEELKIVLSIVKPTSFMPVHGEATHLRAHADLAVATGVNPKNIFICDNGESLELSDKGVKRGKTVQSGIVLVDGLSVGDTSQNILNERNTLSSQGIALISCAIDRKRNQLKGRILIEMHGITGGDDPRLLEQANKTVTKSVQKSLSDDGTTQDLKKTARSSLLSILWERTKQRPMVVVNVIEV